MNTETLVGAQQQWKNCTFTVHTVLSWPINALQRHGGKSSKVNLGYMTRLRKSREGEREEAMEIAQWVQCLLCKHADLSSEQQSDHACIQLWSQAKLDGSLGSLASQYNLLDIFQINEKLKETR